MPSCSQAYGVPVRPMPHITSSSISSTPCRSQISRMRRKYRYGRDCTRGRTDDRLGDEGQYRITAEFLDFSSKFVRHAQAVILRSFIGSLVAIGITGCDVMRLDQQRVELLTPPFVAAGVVHQVLP